MDIAINREQSVLKILHTLVNEMEEGKDEVFEGLCGYFDNDSIAIVAGFFKNKGDSVAIFWLVKYLVRIQRPLGFQIIYELANSDDDMIRGEACRGLAGISSKYQGDYFIKMLDCSYENELIFAIKELGKLRLIKATIPLLNSLHKHQKCDALVLPIVNSLGQIGDVRSIKPLEVFIEQAEGAVREEAILALSQFANVISLSQLKRWLKSNNPDVRELIYLALLRKFGRHQEGAIAKALREENLKLRESILSSIRMITTKKLFHAVFNIALRSQESYEKVLAQSILLKVKSKTICQWILQAEKKEDVGYKNIIFDLLVHYESESSVYRFFYKYSLNSQLPALRLMAIEHLGRQKNAKCFAYLKSIINDDDQYYYVASIALTYKLTINHWVEIEELLSLDDKDRSLAIQVFLKFLLRLNKNVVFPLPIHQKIFHHMKSDNPHIRYLAVRGLARIKEADSAQYLLKIAFLDKCKFVSRAALQGLIEYYQDNPHELTDLLSVGVSERKYLPIIYYIFKNISGLASNFDNILRSLLKITSDYQSQDDNQETFYFLRLMAILRQHINKQKGLFIEFYKTMNCSDGERLILMRIINTLELFEREGVNFDFLAKHYQESGNETKKEYLKFFAKLTLKNKDIGKVVLDDYQNISNKEIHEDIKGTIREWIKSNQLAEAV